MTQQVKNPLAIQETQETWVQSLGQEDPLEEEMATHSIFLPEKSHGQRSLVSYSLKGYKETDTSEHAFWLLCLTSCSHTLYMPLWCFELSVPFVTKVGAEGEIGQDVPLQCRKKILEFYKYF